MEDSLPEELIVRIFERLPIKPLIRFTCLSKRWRFIILSDPHFAKSHFLIASQNRTLTSRLLRISNPVEPDSEPEQLLEFECESHDLGDNNAGGRKLQCPFNPLGRVIGISSCNGLVCVAFWETICIWNPSTGSHTTLPLISSEMNQMIFINDIGFVYVSSSDDYKLIAHIEVIKLDMDEDEDDDYGYRYENEEDEYHIFSLRTNMWKKIEIPPNFIPIPMGKSALSNEAIHWLPICIYNVSAFDLAMEDFRTIPLPRSILQKYNLFSFVSLCLGASLAGSLCLLDNNENKGFADLWVLREYGVMDSWSKQFTFKISMMPYRFSLVTETIILLMAEYPGILTLIRIGHEDEEELEICRVNHSKLGVIVYQETLLWLP